MNARADSALNLLGDALARFKDDRWRISIERQGTVLKTEIRRGIGDGVHAHGPSLGQEMRKFNLQYVSRVDEKRRRRGRKRRFDALFGRGLRQKRGGRALDPSDDLGKK